MRWRVSEDLNGTGIRRGRVQPERVRRSARVGGLAVTTRLAHSTMAASAELGHSEPRLRADGRNGGTYNGVTVTGIGLSKADKIRVSRPHPMSGGDAAAVAGLMHDALNQSCTDLIGTAGIHRRRLHREGRQGGGRRQLDGPWRNPRRRSPTATPAVTATPTITPTATGTATPALPCPVAPRAPDVALAGTAKLLWKQAGGSGDKAALQMGEGAEHGAPGLQPIR